MAASWAVVNGCKRQHIEECPPVLGTVQCPQMLVSLSELCATQLFIQQMISNNIIPTCYES